MIDGRPTALTSPTQQGSCYIAFASTKTASHIVGSLVSIQQSTGGPHGAKSLAIQRTGSAQPAQEEGYDAILDATSSALYMTLRHPEAGGHFMKLLILSWAGLGTGLIIRDVEFRSPSLPSHEISAMRSKHDVANKLYLAKHEDCLQNAQISSRHSLDTGSGPLTFASSILDRYVLRMGYLCSPNSRFIFPVVRLFKQGIRDGVGFHHARFTFMPNIQYVDP
ncbi:hypothetical protein ACRALDRAFT_2023234, partial [Sodiomyces alcalophilus JCM 7366]|uniref:uncharacterized protein n=1 Tax=Sodiomyces alcalophilus JCM 7366 TaxID=591952 RepID=UPI0039B480CD